MRIPTSPAFAPLLMVELTRLSCEAGLVMALRMTLLGAALAPPREALRMYDEKPLAFARAMLAAGQAASLAAWTHPGQGFAWSLAAWRGFNRSLTGKVGSNRRRLVRHASRPARRT